MAKWLTDKLLERNLKLRDPEKLKCDSGPQRYALPRAHGHSLVRYFRDPQTGKQDTLVMGQHPAYSLEQWREDLLVVDRQLQQNVNPKTAKREQERQAIAEAVTFAMAAPRWLTMKKKSGDWGADSSTYGLAEERLEHCVKGFGKTVLRKLKPVDVLPVLHEIEERSIDIANRTHSYLCQIGDYAVAEGWMDHNWFPSLGAALAKPKRGHHAAIIDEQAFGSLLRAIDAYDGHPITKIAFKLSALLMLRPGELRNLEWGDVTLTGKEPQIEIPGTRMKMGKPHICPLSTQAITLFQRLHALTADGSRYCFPSFVDVERPMSNGTIVMALRRIGYGEDQMTAHGFRSSASSILHGRGHNSDVIERCLAHTDSNKIRGIYDRSAQLPQRRALMQAWADICDELKGDKPQPSNVVQFPQHQANA